MQPRILVVEDNPDNMKLFRWTLEDAGYDFTGVGTAEEGLDLAVKVEFDLVVMDISLPGMDGKDAIRWLRSNPQTTHLPIVAATAHAIREEAIAIQSCGVSALITKPIDEELFLETVSALSGATR